MSLDAAAFIAAESATLDRLAAITDPELRRDLFAILSRALDLAGAPPVVQPS